MRKIAVLMSVGVAMVTFFSVQGQTSTNLIDIPTAKLLKKNHYSINFTFYQEGGLLVEGEAGLTEDFTIGASYGGTGVVGTRPLKGNPEPAFSLKYKLGEEGKNMSFSLTVGYEGQGYGKYYRQGNKIEINDEELTLTRSFYQINSKGFYLSLSKIIKDKVLEVHGGINHCLEDDPGRAGLAIFLGANLKVTPKIEAKLEYNNGFHKEIKYRDVFEGYSGPEKLLRKEGGEVNLGFSLQYTPGLSLELDFKDLSQRYSESGNRIFRITYFGEF
ncbi:hypothetical protein J7M02_06480 [Candidatus Aerophobetes bacterium]|nr:hypothetical protein [Candidatus Aerophobetes bacterium]